MKRLLYGSAFDPIHHGHLSMVRAAKEQLGIDEIILLPTKNPRWKSTITPIEHRFNMVQLAFKDWQHVILSREEIDTPGMIHFTIDTVKKYRQRYPDDTLYYLIGSDQVEQFHKWKDAQLLASLIQLVAYPRPHTTLDHPNWAEFHIQALQGPLLDISSTAIRELKQLHTPYPVIEYILQHELYFTKRVQAFYSEKRFLHVLSTAKVAYAIAEANHLPPEKAFLAGLLHDIAKDLDDDASFELIQQYETEKIPFEPYVLHQFAGAILARNEFHIEDEDVLDAIRYHTTGKASMAPYTKIVYAADKIEPTRGYPSQHLIDACKTNLDEGFRAVLKENMMHLKKKSFKMNHPLVKSCMAMYLGEEQ